MVNFFPSTLPRWDRFRISNKQKNRINAVINYRDTNSQIVTRINLIIVRSLKIVRSLVFKYKSGKSMEYVNIERRRAIWTFTLEMIVSQLSLAIRTDAWCIYAVKKIACFAFSQDTFRLKINRFFSTSLPLRTVVVFRCCPIRKISAPLSHSWIYIDRSNRI